jgi:hypothetical protein
MYQMSITQAVKPEPVNIADAICSAREPLPPPKAMRHRGQPRPEGDGELVGLLLSIDVIGAMSKGVLV